MSCLEIQEAPGRQAVCVVQAGWQETGQAVCVQQPGESPLQRPETLSVRQQEEPKFIIEISLQKLPFFLFYEKEKQGVTKREAVCLPFTGEQFLCYTKKSGWHSPSVKYER